MKIAKKIMVTNLIIGFSVTLVLTIMVYIVMSEFIKDNVYEYMLKETYFLADYIQVTGIDGITSDSFEDKDLYYKEGYRSSHIYIILDDEGSPVWHTEYKVTEAANDTFYAELNRASNLEYTTLQLGGYPVVIYKRTLMMEGVDGKQTIQLIALTYDSLFDQLLLDLMMPVIVGILVVIVLSALLAMYFGRRISRPVTGLIDLTKRIGEKEKVENPIGSGDEFQIIGEAMEEMSVIIHDKDLESKRFYEHVSHDLKTPLTIISGYAEGLASGLFEDTKEPLEKIIKQSGYLKEQIEDVIFLSQLETERQHFDLESTILESAIGDVLDDFEILFVKNDIEVTFEPTNHTAVALDSDKFKRALNNVVANAVKYATKELSIQLEILEGHVSVLIQDDGPGFEEDWLVSSQEDSYIKSDSGNGIGLRIVKRIMEGHEGNVQLGNSATGARVRLTLPLRAS